MKLSFQAQSKKPQSLETDDVKDFSNKVSTILLKTQNAERNSLYSSKITVFAERFNRPNKSLPMNSVFKSCYAKWTDILRITKNKYKTTIPSALKLAPVKSSLKENASFVEESLIDQRGRENPKKDVLFRTTDNNNFF